MRRARVRTTHADAATARAVAAALGPDNTDEMDTTVDGATVTTTVHRSSTGGLQATVDDYVVNLQVATRLATRPDSPTVDGGTETDDTGTDTERQTDGDTQT
ncbi:MAG: KEOPS complex Pcc1-like subunit [Halobacteriales archaeon SW_9_67_25]|jgi:hypothetical protein|nr:MAG: KEOPS complex Pcc1-like subunit [Halobacteriales archaeon SW_9_67_25]